MALTFQGLLGVILIPLLVWITSEARRHFPPQKLLLIILSALIVQAALALILLRLPSARYFFDGLAGAVVALQAATDTGSRLLFGYLAGGPAPYTMSNPENAYLLAFRALPMILVLSAIVRLLYHWGVLQRVVAAFAVLLRRTVGAGGALGTVAAASVFLGTVEAPLMIRPYLKNMGRGALFATMVVLMSTVAGTVMALYAGILAPVVPGAAGHLLAASVMNVPGALMLSRLAVPQGFEDSGPHDAQIVMEDAPVSSMDAIAQGAIEGLKLVATVASLLIVIVSLVALLNMMLSAATAPFGGEVSLQSLLGILMAPVAWVIGIPWSEATTAGSLLGQKFVLNELLAYLEMAQAPPAEALTERSRLIMTYALCGFANLGSLGILIGGMSAMMPERRSEIVALAPRAVIVGFLATLLSASIIGCIA